MHPAFLLVAASVVGIDVGWQPLKDGGVEYIIQIEPDQVDRLMKVDDLLSDVPADLDIRRYRITIGTEKLPHLTQQAKTITIDPPDDRISDQASPASASEPISGTTAVSAEKPVSGNYASSDPEPEDEEALAADSRSAKSSREPARRNDLFDRPLRTTKSSSLDEPAPRSQLRLQSQGNRDEELSDADYAANKPPALPSSYRTASTLPRERTSSSNDRVTGDDKPWAPLMMSMFLFFLSMGGNMYLGWIAWEARTRYRVLLDKFRAQGGTGAVDLV